MKNFVLFSAVCVILAIACGGCASAKVNYKIDGHGNMIVEQTEGGKHGISDDAVSASRDAADFEKNMVIKAMWKKYLTLIDKGKYPEAEKILKEIKKVSGEYPEPPKPETKEPKKEKKLSGDVPMFDNDGNGKLSYWKK